MGYNRAVLAHLAEAGATSVSILRDGRFAVGTRPDRDSIAAFWVPAVRADMVVEKARAMIRRGDPMRMLREAAAQCGVVLVPHERAYRMAKDSAAVLDRAVELAKSDGRMAKLIAEQRSYAAAEMKLRQTLMLGSVASQMVARAFR